MTGDDRPEPHPGTEVLEEIPEEECLALLAAHSVGRVVFVDHEGQPGAVPVNYVLDGRTVAFRTDPGTKLDSSVLGKVAFEIDGIDELYREGWSVLVTGVGREITDAIDRWSERVRSHRLYPWASGAKEHWIAIATPSFSGRRIRHSGVGD
ncbi:MAG TPA: pyridoxamine 5'-phosphate oxidase family protein [Acidimicrobiaceae bacterium]|nr:pyridoxamine 5'-phosphate oxidase family protein [Acidimicrobiaceae bacterium]